MKTKLVKQGSDNKTKSAERDRVMGRVNRIARNSK